MLKRIFLICACASLLSLTACRSGGVDLGQGMAAGSDAYKAATLSEADAVKNAKAAAVMLDKQNSVAPAGNKYAKRLANITAKLKNEDGLNLNFKVYQTADVNAFAMADGTVRVFTGLLDLMTDDELFFILGHEIGHVKLGHTLNAMRVEYAAAAARKGAGAAGGAAGALSQSQLGELGEKLVNAQFSQSQESDSDTYGYKMMQKYGKPTTAAVSALRKFASLGGNSGMLSSHPDSSKRADRLEGMTK